MKSDTRFCQTDKILQTVGSSISTNDSIINSTEVKVIYTFLQNLFVQYLHKGVNVVLSLQPHLPVSLWDDILCHLNRGVSTVVSL